MNFSIPSHIKSYVLCNRRLTRGQKKALQELLLKFSFPIDNLENQKKLVDQKPLIVEIGSGSGESTIEWCFLYPSHYFLAIEVYLSGLGQLIQNANQRECANLAVLKKDAMDLFQENKIKIPIYGLHIFFPDPWPKRKHHKRRLITTSFILQILPLIEVGGYIYSITDDFSYAIHIEEAFSDIPSLSREKNNPIINNTPLSKYAKKALEKQKEIFSFFYRKY